MEIKALHPLFTAEDIQARVVALGKEIDATYGNESLVAVGVLKGASIFFADLVRAISKPRVELDFVRLASYGNEDVSSAEVVMSKSVDTDLGGKHVLLIEDIIDTGHSMAFLQKFFLSCNVASLRIAVLVDKHERRQAAIEADFVGFQLSEGFIVGYGLDYAEQCRNLPGLYTAELASS